MQPANVTICSPFRDSAAGINEYMNRIADLDYSFDARRYVWVEGDSVDDTARQLLYWAEDDPRVTLVRCNTGVPRHGSIVHPERFKALAQVFNAALDAVDLAWSDYVLFLPSDIVYSPDLLSRLLAHGAHIMAPFSWTEYGRFYDTWGFTRRGEEFGRFTMASGRVAYGDEPIRMDTVGGTVLIRSDVLRAGCRYTPEEVDRGLCKAARAQGFLVWADPSTHVFHPPFDPALLNGFAALTSLTAEAFRATVHAKYGFDCGERYAKDFVAFWEQMNRE